MVIGQKIIEKKLRNISKSISDKIEPKIYPEISKAHFEGQSCVEVQFKGSSVPYFAFERGSMKVQCMQRED